ncbi:copper resistance CopC family protein [Peribacillus deserti]|nr:copper resistance protein CopC [Peribacillus deserti]
MKKMIFLILSIFLIVPTYTSAHTGLVSSNPQSGEVVKEDLTEVQLVFETAIEDLSTIKLYKNNTEIPFTKVRASEFQLIGSLSAPLENGTYKMNWRIVGEDGHPIEGNIPFTVEQEEKMDNDHEAAPSEVKEPKKEEKPTKGESADTTTSKDNTGTDGRTILVVILGVILIAGLVILFRKKK